MRKSTQDIASISPHSLSPGSLEPYIGAYGQVQFANTHELVTTLRPLLLATEPLREKWLFLGPSPGLVCLETALRQADPLVSQAIEEGQVGFVHSYSPVFEMEQAIWKVVRWLKREGDRSWQIVRLNILREGSIKQGKVPLNFGQYVFMSQNPLAEDRLCLYRVRPGVVLSKNEKPATYILRNRAVRYIREVLACLDLTQVNSLILYGSYVRGDACPPSPHSDVDLLVVLRDSCLEREVMHVRCLVERLNIRYGYQPERRGRLAQFMHRASRKLGIAQDRAAVCRRSDLVQGRAYRVKGAHPLSHLFFPVSIWLNTLLDVGLTIYGEDMIGQVARVAVSPRLETIRSAFIYITRTVGYLPLVPFFWTQLIPAYYIALKGSLFHCYYLLEGHGACFETNAHRFSRLMRPRFLQTWLRLRQADKEDVKLNRWFALRVVYYLLKIHWYTLTHTGLNVAQ